MKKIRLIVFSFLVMIGMPIVVSGVDYSVEYNELWSKQYGPVFDELVSIETTADGGYILAGVESPTSATTTSSGWLLKVDASGNEIWSKTYNYSGRDLLYSVIPTKDGGYIASGYESEPLGTGTGYTSGWLLKVDANGNELWSKSYGTEFSDYLTDIKEISGGGYIVSGEVRGTLAGETNFGGTDGWLLKIDADGNEIWSKQYGTSDSEELNGITITADGSYIAAGMVVVSNGTTINSGGWALKVDANGNQIWSKQFDTTGTGCLEKIIKTSDNYFVIAGYSGDIFNDGSYNGGLEDGWILKLDSDGNEIWSKPFGTSASDSLLDIQEANDGNYIASGSTQGTTTNGVLIGSNDGWVLKVDPDGNELWSSQYGETNYNILYSITQSKDGGYAAAGFSYDSNSTGWIIKLEGELEYQVSFDANGGKGAMDSISLKRNTTITLPANAFTNDGHEFVGWATSKSDADSWTPSDIKVSNVTLITNGGEYTHTVTEDISLYAVWKQLNSGDGDNDGDSNGGKLPDTGNSIMNFAVMLMGLVALLALLTRKKIV